jgi:signal transduction histidine kinase
VSRRLLISYVSLVVFVLLALSLPLGLSFANAERRRVASTAQHDAFAIALRAEPELGVVADTDAVHRLFDELSRRTNDDLVLVDAAGEVVASTGRPATGPGLPARDLSTDPTIAAALRGEDTIHTATRGGIDFLDVAVPVLARRNVVGAVRVSVDLARLESRVANNWLRLLALGGVVLAVVLLVSVLLARSFTRPLQELDRVARRLGEGELDARVKVPDDPPELRRLASSFNGTAERLAALLGSQRAFVADASHQLRTPLTALLFRLENLEAVGGASPEDLDAARREVLRLSQLVDGLLELARAEQAVPASDDVSLREVVDERTEAWWPLAAERHVTLETGVADVTVRSVPGRLEQVLDNLLNNALDVAPAGSVVQITGGAHAGQVVLEVLDAGPGMSAEDRARAFDRFWRAPGTERDHVGFGLGLAIVRELVRADGGDVVLADAPGGGLRVVIVLARGRNRAERPDARPDARPARGSTGTAGASLADAVLAGVPEHAAGDTPSEPPGVPVVSG